MAKIIALCFDGTWNTPDTDDADGDSSTNVRKLYDAIAPVNAEGLQQTKWYATGVGTKWYNKVRGGMMGVGLSTKIQKGYAYLANTYEEGDQICIYGFSRGAYCARSLVGLIRNAGLLRRENAKLTPEAYSLYRTRDEGADTETAKFFRNRYSREVPIHLLGVWDTVGALGIPVESFAWFNKSYYQFHDCELSGIVRNAFHAMAVDEHRKNYTATLWNPKQKPNQRVEQVWFCGAHANVGGGYASSDLSDIALRWMMQKSLSCGVAVDTSKIPALPPVHPPIVDSYSEFLRGAYSKLLPRHYRKIGGTIHGLEAIDETVIQRVRDDANYRPKNEVESYLTGEIKPLGRLHA